MKFEMQWAWGLFALLAAIIALSYPPREHTQKNVVPDQVTMGAPTMPAFVARAIHIQKDSPPQPQAGVPLDAAFLTASFAVQANHSANPPYTARESYKAVTGLHAPRNRVLLFWKGSIRSRLA
jgi:hypothetical protein